MRLGRRKTNPNRGAIDGGAGRGVPMDPVTDEEDVPQEREERDAFAVLDEESDASPDDRRRDPLRQR